MAERSKALDWNSSYARKGIRGFESHSLRHILSRPHPSMVARTGFSATTSHKSRQARKGATVVTMSGAGGQAGAGRLQWVDWKKVACGAFFGWCPSLPAAKSVVFAACVTA
jgi:hypothetical protein